MKWLILISGISANAFASVLIKVAVSEPRKLPSLSDPISGIANWPFWLALALYGAAFTLYAASLTRFPLNVAHPILTTGAVAMVSLLSVIMFKEPFYWTNAVGIIFVIIGVVLISTRIS